MVYQRADIERIPAYVQGKSLADAVKLSSNENPYPPLASVLEATRERLESFNLYPDMGAVALRERIAGHHGVRPEEVAVGAGSVEVAAQLVNASAGAGDEVMFAWRSFEAYPIMTQIAGATAQRVPLDAEDRHDLRAMADRLDDTTRLVLVCNPNNPTGTAVGAADLDDFIARVPDDVLVVLDEAYAEFIEDGPDGLAYYRERPNVAVLRTFSKAYGLAALRVGYCIAHDDVSEAMRKVQVPFGVSTIAQAAAIASLAAEDELLDRVRVIAQERERLLDGLAAEGYRPARSEANFAWLRLGAATVDFAAACDAVGIAVRPFPGEGVRITVGDAEATDRLLEVARGWPGPRIPDPTSD